MTHAVTAIAPWPWPDDAAGRVVVLGPWSLTVDGVTVGADRLAGPRGVTLLARLAWSAGEVVDRETLAAAVWGADRPATWQSSLRNLVAASRKAIGDLPGVRLETLTAGLLLDVDGTVVTDAALLATGRAEVEAHRRAGNLAAALDGAQRLLRSSAGALAVDIVGPWAETVRRTVSDDRVRLALLGSETALRLGDAEQAVELARLALSLRPREEAGHQALMRAQHAVGDRAAALDTYTELRELLREEFGSTPSQATQDVFLDILRHEEAGAVRDRRRLLPFATGRLRLIDSTQPLVGRAAELDRAVEHLLGPRATTSVLVLTGTAGIGKTRLAAAVAARAHAAGTMVLHGRADSRVAAPYATVAEALDSHLGLLGPQELADLAGNHTSVLSRYLPSCRSLWPAVEPTGSNRLERLHAETALCDLLARLADAGPTLLVLDDLQWSSTTTVRLVEALLRGPDVPGLAVLALQRPGTEDDALPNPTHPPPGEGLDRPTEGRLLRMDLGPLDRDAVDRLVHEVAASATSATSPTGDERAGQREEERASVAALTDAVWRIGAGHPLVTTTLLRSRATGLVQLARPTVWGPLTQELVTALPEDTAAVLRAAAAADGPLTPSTVADATGLSAASVAAIMTGAVGLGILSPGAISPTGAAVGTTLNSVVAAAVRETMSAAELEALRERLNDAAALGSGDDAPPAPLVPAPTRRPSRREWTRQVRAAVPSMRSAIDRGEYLSAVSTGLAAFHLLERADDPDEQVRWQLQILLGEAWRALGDERAHATLHDVVDEARRAGDVLTMAEAALAFTATGTGTDEAHLSDALLALYEEVLAGLGEGEPGLRARLLGHLGTAYGWRHSAEKAAEATTTAIALAEELGDPDTLISVYTTGRRALAGSGMVDHQEFFEQRLLQLTADYNDPPTTVRTAIWQFESQVQRGRGDDLETLLSPDETALRMVRDTGSRHSLLYSRAALHLLRGELEEADAAIEEAAEVGRRNAAAATIVEAIRLIQLMLLRFEQGRLAEVRAELAAFCATQDVPEWWGSMAFADAAIGLDAEVPRELDVFFTGFERAGARIAIPHGLAALMATPLRRFGQVERARRLYDVLLPASGTGGYVGCFSGPIDHSLGVLADCLGDAAAARQHFTAAADFCRRLGAPLWLERCDAELAALDLRTA
ncbi:AAA family ATPase [Nocardioides sp.]|uniref:AAA family ATPase n=1 Tax=Nocardioides sp. TaxID=35761 RepID=UPI0035190315